MIISETLKLLDTKYASTLELKVQNSLDLQLFFHKELKYVMHHNNIGWNNKKNFQVSHVSPWLKKSATPIIKLQINVVCSIRQVYTDIKDGEW